MPRRTHRKSRNGCLECKRRHVKCDEKQPICSNCTVSERVCDYGTRFITAAPRAPLVQSASAAPTSVPRASPDSSPAAFADQPVNMLHVELFHNLYTQTHATFRISMSMPWIAQIITHSITTPYLVNEMLAFSALHLSTTRPPQREFYRYHAAQLQTQALAIFKDSNPTVTQETCIPLFLFSSLLGIHMLCDTLIYRENDFVQFLDRFVHYLRLHHGVRTILGQAWPMLRGSLLQPAFEIGMALYKLDGPLGPECENLLNRVVAAKLTKDLTDTYRRAIEALQSCLNVAEKADEQHASINAVVAWPVLISLDFSDLLEQRRPEALVILAHYAVLLHRFRDSWVLGGSGRFVIEEVTRYLGEEWDGWLRWPGEELHC
ncbi:uncharacterized protein BJX67DRAFT_391171 [Aspergillus lucknowensis]|uniref:Zn(2)-C6 fungal-type domain-containing protein n=1 Tax=Aspergillus lucknowensis TaxID=176173 RepID=A0ABR4LGN2_9EURO